MTSTPHSRAADQAMLAFTWVLLLACLVIGKLTFTLHAALWVGLPVTLIASLGWYAAPGSLFSRLLLAAVSMSLISLQINQTQGLIEIHFGVFVLMAFLLIYRDWRPLLMAALVIAAQHILLGYLQIIGVGVYCFSNPSASILLLHLAYVVFEAVILSYVAIVLHRNTLTSDSLRMQVYEHDMAQKKAIEEKDAAESADLAKSQFLATMSHEIRTPMNGVVGMTEHLLDTPLSQEQQDLAQTILGSAQSLLRVINDILDLSKLESGQFALVPRPFDPQVLVKGVIDLLRARADEKQLALTCELSSTARTPVIGDDVRLRQILINLVSNAIKFTPHGHVQVAVLATTDTENTIDFEFKVIDTGIGIDTADQPRLFQRFTQAYASIAREYGGTGLGLAISRRLVEQMDGAIDLESAPGKGSTFRFTVSLPVAAVVPHNYREKPPAPAVSRKDISGTRVLVVDDNKVNREVARRMLSRLDILVDIACDGAEGVEMASQGDYDLILMDVHMPVMDGHAATRLIRALPHPKDLVPILAMTASAMPTDYEACIVAGMDDYISKPIDREQFFDKLYFWITSDTTKAG